MSCTQQEISDALDAQLVTVPNLDLTNIAYLGRFYSPEAETPYLATSMPMLDTKMITLGPTGVFQWMGLYQVQANWPAGGGLQNLTEQLDAIRAVFPNALTLTTFSGFFIRCYKAQIKPPFSDGAWLRGAVHVPWFLQESSD